MAPRKGRGKAKKTTERQEKLKAMIADFDKTVEKHIQSMEKDCEEMCTQIDQVYRIGLFDIDAKYHDMTVDEIIASQTATPKQTKQIASISAMGNRFKCLSEKKLLLSAARSATKSVQNMRKRPTDAGGIMRGVKRPAPSIIESTVKKTGNMKMKRRILGSMQLMTTPHYKRKPTMLNTSVNKPAYKVPKKAVTPKFDPRTPLPNMLLRKPKAGEVIMSLSGSPIQNWAPPSVLEEPGLLLSLGEGRVIDLRNQADLNNVIELDSETEKNLKLVQEKLAGLINR